MSLQEIARIEAELALIEKTVSEISRPFNETHNQQTSTPVYVQIPAVNRESDCGMVSQSPIVGLDLENEAPLSILRHINVENVVDSQVTSSDRRRGRKVFSLEETNQGLHVQ